MSKRTIYKMIPKRICHFANLPMKLCMPSSFENIREIAFKTQRNATKIEIKRYLESVYGFEIEKVDTLNRLGRKKKVGKFLLTQPSYKKAYVTLKNSLSLSPNLFPISLIEKERQRRLELHKPAQTMLESGPARSHWLDGEVSEPRVHGRYARYGARSWAPESFRDGREGPYSRGRLKGRVGWDGWLPRNRRPLVPEPNRSRMRGYDIGDLKFPWKGKQSSKQ